MTPRRITMIATGGTIEKTYDEHTGELRNRITLVHRMLENLRLEETEVRVVELMHKDSLDLDDADRSAIVDAVRGELGGDGTEPVDGVVILHGTDTMTTTGDLLAAELGAPPCPVVLTGAIRPFEMKRSDAMQNLTEAVFATGALAPGVWIVAHGRALRLPGAVKDAERQTFVPAEGVAGDS